MEIATEHGAHPHLLQNYSRAPITIVRGEGVELIDEHGNRYIDLVAGIAVAALGHCHPEITRAIAEQAATLVHCSNLYMHEPAGKLATKLAELSGFDRVFFCNSGAEANEAAIKMARKFAHRNGQAHRKTIVYCTDSFHGRTLGALAATDSAKYKEGFEPLQGESGVNVADREFLQAARALCDKHGALLIYDEIQCGLGRLGTNFAFETYNVKPDAFTLAKSLANGLPIGALVMRGPCAEALKPGDHGTTFGGSPIPCAAALRHLELREELDLNAHVHRVGTKFLGELRALAEDYPEFFGPPRGMGLMLGLPVKEPEQAQAFVDEARDRHLLINAAGHNTLRFIPPLIITEEQISEAFSRLRKAVAQIGPERTGAAATHPGAESSKSEAVREIPGELIDADALLAHRVAIAYRDGLILHRLVVDRDAERRPDLVLTPVELPDIPLVVLRAEKRTERVLDEVRSFDQVGLVARQRKNRNLDGRDARMEAQDDPFGLLSVGVDDPLLLVRIDQHRQGGPVHPGRALDQDRGIFPLRRFVVIGEVFPREAHMRVEVVRPAMRDRLELAPSPREEVLDVGSGLGVVRSLLRLQFIKTQPFRLDSIVGIPLFAGANPLLVPFEIAPVVGDEIFELRLFEFADPKRKVSGRDLISERLPDLSDTERRSLSSGLVDVLEVDEDPLSRLRTQVRDRSAVLHRSDARLHHEIEVARLRQRPAHPAIGTLVERAEMVRPEAVLAVAAVDELVVKCVDVARGDPSLRMHDDRRVEGDDVVPQIDDLPPPRVLDVPLEERTERPIIPKAVDPPVDLARGEDKTAALCQRRDFVHRDVGRNL